MAAPSTARPQKPFLRRAARKLKRVLSGSSPAPVAAKKKRRPKPRPFQPDSQLRCLVCGSDKLAGLTIERPRTGSVSKRHTGRILNLLVCEQCRYVSSPDASHDYAKAASTSGLSGGVAPRCATVERPGRETGMARLGLEVLQRPEASVLVYGAGSSLDVHHIAKLPLSGRVAVGDLVKLRADAEFFDINELSTDPFDVVVASEVLEHFPDPWKNLQNLFSYVKDDGIVVASTNIRDHGSLNTVNYLWCRGHVSYFSAESLRIVARAEGMHLDFRFPLIATRYKRPCKRYIIFSRSAEVMEAVSDWFGSEVYAPSEPLNSTRKTRAEVRLPPGARLPNLAPKPVSTPKSTG
jgi:SAM-dependent methyltransferase